MKNTLENLKEEFINSFTVWNDREKYATLYGKEEYPTPDMIADWWIKEIKELLKTVLKTKHK